MQWNAVTDALRTAPASARQLMQYYVLAVDGGETCTVPAKVYRLVADA
jgi:hypothetical protein